VTEHKEDESNEENIEINDQETKETSEKDSMIPLADRLLTDTSFDVLKGYISESSMKAIKEMGFSEMTEIQAKCIDHLLVGK
jgi:ATP-dependent RNA helicase DDX18/HAS1